MLEIVESAQYKIEDKKKLLFFRYDRKDQCFPNMIVSGNPWISLTSTWGSASFLKMLRVIRLGTQIYMN